MFRKEIKFIYDFTLNKVKMIGTYLTFDQIVKAEIHPSILHYISAEIDFLIFEDRQKILKDSVFDYSGEKISDLFSKIAVEVKKNKRFSLEYIAKLILHSTSFNINYLARPRWSLMKLIFEDEEHKSTTEIKQVLNYVYYYEYLKKIIVSYINRKKILSLNYNEFEELLNKIDELGVQSNAKIIVESALESMVSFFNLGEPNKQLIPLQAVELFLREKNLLNYIERLKIEFPQDDKLVYGLNDYKKVFASIKEERIEVAEKFEQESVGEENTPIEYEEERIEAEEEQIEKESKSEERFKISIHQESIDDEETLVHQESVLKSTDIIKDDSEKELIEEKTNEEFKEQEQEGEIEEGEMLEESEPEEIFELADEEIESDDIEAMDEKSRVETQGELKDEEESNLTFEEETQQTNSVPEKVITKMISKSVDTSDKEPTLFEVLEEAKDEEDKIEPQTEQKMQIDKSELTEEETDYFSDTGTKLELSKLLERKNITKVIEKVFDYDIEDFANTIDNACSYSTKTQAMSFLNELFERNKIETSSKEAETIKSIITEFFDRKTK